MKKLIAIMLPLALTLCIIFGMTACGEAEKENDTAETTTVAETGETDGVAEIDSEDGADVTDTADSSDVQGENWFTVDGNFINIELDANPTTGYEWTYAIADEKVVEYVSDNYTADSHAEGMVGVGGVYSASFQGASAGETDITFTYARSWETTAEDISHTLHIVVDADGTVTATEVIK